MTDSSFSIEPIPSFTKNLPGYYVTSTASINVEDEPSYPNASVEEPLREMAQYLAQSNNPQIVVSIHGYGTKRSGAKERFQIIHQYATRICQPETSIFLGYCWPSENPKEDEPDREHSNQKAISFQDKLGYALKSLPTLLIGIFSSSIVLGIITTLLIFFQTHVFPLWVVVGLMGLFSLFATRFLLGLGDADRLLPRLPLWVLFWGLLISSIASFSPINIQGLLIIFLIVCVSSLGVVLALVALRLSTYLRDNYRATNYGVLDLVELIRQLDQAVFETKILNLIETKNLTEELLNELGETKEAWQAADRTKRIELWRQASQRAEVEQEIIKQIPKIQLNFIGHSMGCMVVTNTIRILSDVFDPNSIQKNPSSEIGRVFSLGRLVLVAPDIPTEAIMPRRANFLRSSLRRCEEAYVFSNEGDLALRLASTAANYFSFPARTRFSGYRLGNLTVKHFESQSEHRRRTLEAQDYGIVNLKDGKITKPYLELEIRVSNQEHRSLNELRPLDTVEKDKSDLVEDLPVADLFTYFDCTDYTDVIGPEGSQKKGIVSYALKKSVLNFWDYFKLIDAYFLKKGSQNINVHGGYFYGNFSQQAICKLAFLGFEGFLNTLKSDASLREQLTELSTQCRQKFIQVVLSSRVEKRLNPEK